MPVSVAFSVDTPLGSNAPAGAVSTTIMRADINSSLGVSGTHGFVWSLPNTYRDGASHVIYAYGLSGGSPVLLVGSPFPFSISPPVSGTNHIKYFGFFANGGWGSVPGSDALSSVEGFNNVAWVGIDSAATEMPEAVKDNMKIVLALSQWNFFSNVADGSTLLPNYQSVWESEYAPVVSAYKNSIAAIYVMDEPYWARTFRVPFGDEVCVGIHNLRD